ncbi:MAG: hypothetical protein JSR17_08025 [Proteobacteria bacterium]|nr:hypothetical protein [Pseudomonadota bacterium]
MKVVKKNHIDCILFSYKAEYYLLPTVAFAELANMGEFHLIAQGPLLGVIDWRHLTLPLVAPDLSEEVNEKKRLKFAVLHSLCSNKTNIPYFSILMENHPGRIKIKPQDLTWIDEVKSKALLAKEGTLPKEVTLVDLQKLSLIVEEATSHKSP